MPEWAIRDPIPALSRAFCPWICEIASTLDKKLSQWIQGPILDGQDSHLPGGRGQFDWHPNWHTRSDANQRSHKGQKETSPEHLGHRCCFLEADSREGGHPLTRM
jgi:hypothetical protein